MVCTIIGSVVNYECLYPNDLKIIALRKWCLICVCDETGLMKLCALLLASRLTGAVITATFFLFLLHFVKLQLGASLIYASNPDTVYLMCLLFQFFVCFLREWQQKRLSLELIWHHKTFFLPSLHLMSRLLVLHIVRTKLFTSFFSCILCVIWPDLLWIYWREIRI